VEDFEAHRDYLRAVAHHMLGSASEAEDAVQEAWLRLANADTDDIRNSRAWLTTVLARVCLDMLRSRTSRREVPLNAPLAADGADPEQEAILADSVGIALMVVLDALTPGQRFAFVLHDVFSVPFDEIASIIGRSTEATKMLASRARHRVRSAHAPNADLSRQRAVVDAFLAASRDGDFAALLDLLDPDVIVRADAYAAPRGVPTSLHGARAVAQRAMAFSHRAKHARTGLANGVPAIVVTPRGRLATVMIFAFRNGKIVTLDIIADPRRLKRIAIASP
jgi:RNA polymerase sigma-70 factor (ECF subfamily)